VVEVAVTYERLPDQVPVPRVQRAAQDGEDAPAPTAPPGATITSTHVRRRPRNS
jgi:hypothetical protein